MNQQVYEVVTEHVIPTGNPVQGKTQMSQWVPKRFFFRMLQKLAEGWPCKIGYVNLLVFDDAGIIIKVPCGPERIAVCK